MKQTIKRYIFSVSVAAILTLGAAAFITAGEESAAMTKGLEIKRYKLTEETICDELEAIKDFIFSFLPFRE